MKLISLNCPNCGAELEVENGIDMFFCKYCGHKIMLSDQSDTVVEAKVRIKEMEFDERKDIREQASANKESLHSLILVLCILPIIGLLSGYLFFFNETSMQERQFQKTVNVIMEDIKDGDYSEAYIKASTLYWDADSSEESKKRWDATREEILRQIQAAEEANSK